MEPQQMTKALLEAKKAKGLSFEDLGKIVGKSEVWIAALIYRQASASYEDANQIASALGQGPDVVEALTECPTKGLGPMVPTDPLIYRLYEIMQVYGYPLKSVIHEKFGDGIMSAIDFTMKVEKEPSPQGERVKVIMSGKFLPYKQW